ncbi:glycosyltransferase [Candidatus Aerophobetes bacterium]|nr:glycosyltransferase [Candidatus Aerophobetes bacterium]
MKLYKADLHVHSEYSKIEGGALKRITHSESYTPPEEVYRIAKKRGMDFITITDHNSIQGALKISHFDDVFISEEVTTKFPEDGCEIHLITLNINEKQHREIQLLRNNVYELRDYLNSQSIIHFVAHPFSSVNGKLKQEHWEKMLLLFDVFEVKNGIQKEKDNNLVEQILKNLSRERIERLIDQYGILPESETPWKKSMVGGSDDHGGLYIGQTYTAGEGPGLKDFLKSIKDGKCRAEGKSGTCFTIGHSIYATGYKFYKYKLRKRGRILKFLDKLINDERKGKILEKVLLRNGQGKVSIFPRRFFISYFIKKFSKKMPFLHTLRAIDKINKNIPLSTALFPYFFGLAYQNKDRDITKKVKLGYLGQGESLKVAIFTDFIENEKNFLSSFISKINSSLNGEKLKILCCDKRKIFSSNGIKTFHSMVDFPFPLYPAINFHIPSLLDILLYCEQEEFTLIHTLTPGPMGIVSIIVSRILKLPLIGTYQIDFVKLLSSSTKNESLKNMAWRYLNWYYTQMDKIFTLQRYVQQLREKNIPEEKIKIIDTEKEYSPSSNPDFPFAQILDTFFKKNTFNQIWRAYEEIYMKER